MRKYSSDFWFTTTTECTQKEEIIIRTVEFYDVIVNVKPKHGVLNRAITSRERY